MVEIINGIHGSDSNVQFQCVQAARKLLSRERHPPIDDIIEAGVIPRLVEFLTHCDRYVADLSSRFLYTEVLEVGNPPLGWEGASCDI